MDTFKQRELDWRYGGILYQVFVDRFVPSLNLEAKKHLYPHPKRLLPWQTLPQRGKKTPESPYWSHELDFWGGDLLSLMTKIDYIKDLGVNTLYLNPIFDATSNHKYDTLDYEVVSPEYGTLKDLKALIDVVHQHHMTIMLDGVFNHMAIASPKFQSAHKDLQSPFRDWFVFGNQFSKGVRLWHNAPSLPELNLKNPMVRAYLFTAENSIVKRYLKMGIDGWRLDTAIELGYQYLSELTQSAHEVNAKSVVIGELNNYPSGWAPAMDGTMLFPVRDAIILLAKQRISPMVFAIDLAKLIQETTIDTMLMSWILLENHDTSRIATELPQFASYFIAKILQFTLPGTVNLYMGEEIGTKGGDDPLNRATFNWANLKPSNPYHVLHRQLIELRKSHRALRVGNIQFFHSKDLVVFERVTNRVDETIIVIVNPNNTAKEEMIMISDPLLKSHNQFVDLLSNQVKTVSHGIYLPVKIPAQSAWILKPKLSRIDGYTPYKNILEDIN